MAYVQSVAGSSPRVGTNQSRSELTVILKPWEERKKGGMSLKEVMNDVRTEFKQYPEALVFLSTPPLSPDWEHREDSNYKWKLVTGPPSRI